MCAALGMLLKQRPQKSCQCSFAAPRRAAKQHSPRGWHPQRAPQCSVQRESLHRSYGHGSAVEDPKNTIFLLPPITKTRVSRTVDGKCALEAIISKPSYPSAAFDLRSLSRATARASGWEREPSNVAAAPIQPDLLSATATA